MYLCRCVHSVSLTEHSITIQVGDKQGGLLALDKLSTNQGRDSATAPPIAPPATPTSLHSISNVPLSQLQLATHACRHPMNDNQSGRGCRPWPSSVCLTDIRAISACCCNQNPPAIRQTVADCSGPISPSLIIVFVHSFAICTASVWVNTMSADN